MLEVAEGIIAEDNHRDLQTVLDFYAHEAVLLPPGEPAVHGVAAIRPRYEALFESFEPAIVLHVGNVSVCGDLAVVSGRNEGVLHARSGAGDRTLNDTFVMVLRKTDAVWRITRLMWHPREGG